MAARDRPRRSTAKTGSYAVDIDLGDAESGQTSSEDAQPRRPGDRAKGKRRAVTLTSEDESDVSEFGQSDVDADEAESDIEADELAEDEALPSADDGPAVEEEDDDEQDEQPSAPSSGNVSPALASRRRSTQTPGSRTVTGATGKGRATSVVMRPGYHSKSLVDFRLPTYDQPTGIIWQPEPTYRLPAPFDDPANFHGESAQAAVAETGVDQQLNANLGRYWLTAIFGLVWPLVEDVAFFPRPPAPSRPPPDTAPTQTQPRRPLDLPLDRTSAEKYLPTQRYFDAARGQPTNAMMPDSEQGTAGSPFFMGVADPDGSGVEAELRLDLLASCRLDAHIPRKPGFLLHAGGPVQALDWLPVGSQSAPPPNEILAVGTFSSDRALSPPAAPTVPNTPALVQLWEVPAHVGEAWQLQWRPEPYLRREGSLGHLAGCFADGGVAIYDVPDPQTLTGHDGPFVHCDPLVRLILPDTAVTVIDWGSADMLIGGCGNGFVVVWYVAEAIALGLPTVRPAVYAPGDTAPIVSLCVVRIPPLSVSGTEETHEEPQLICLSDNSGLFFGIDLRDPWTPMQQFYERTGGGCLSWSPLLGCPISNDAEHNTRLISLKARYYAQTTRLVQTSGAIRHLAANQYSPFYAIASADGMCAIDNALRHQVKEAGKPVYGRVVYRMDYNRNTGRFRMIDNEMPKTVSGTRGVSMSDEPVSAAWPPAVAISGMACGLARIDMIEDDAVPAMLDIWGAKQTR